MDTIHLSPITAQKQSPLSPCWSHSYFCLFATATEDSDGGFVVSSCQFPGVAEQGESLDEAFDNFRETLQATVSVYLSEGMPLPAIDADANHQASDHIREVMIYAG